MNKHEEAVLLAAFRMMRKKDRTFLIGLAQRLIRHFKNEPPPTRAD